MTSALLDLGSEEFVLLTTFRKTGDPVRTVTARALVHSDDDTLAALDAALLAKYGLKFRAIRASQRLRRTTNESVALVITAA